MDEWVISNMCLTQAQNRTWTCMYDIHHHPTRRLFSTYLAVRPAEEGGRLDGKIVVRVHKGQMHHVGLLLLLLLDVYEGERKDVRVSKCVRAKTPVTKSLPTHLQNQPPTPTPPLGAKRRRRDTRALKPLAPRTLRLLHHRHGTRLLVGRHVGRWCLLLLLTRLAADEEPVLDAVCRRRVCMI